MIFETPRLAVRAWEDCDAAFVFDTYSRWEVVRYLGSSPTVVTTMDEARQRLQRWQSVGDPTTPYGIWAVTLRATAEPIGLVVLKRLPLSGEEPLAEGDDVEIGWHLHPDRWGHGYATEAAAGLAQRAWDTGHTEVFAITYPENTPSQAVCRRIGMTHLGQTDRYYNITAELFHLAAPASGERSPAQ